MGLDFSASAEIGTRKALATPRMKDAKKRFFIESVLQVRLFTSSRVNEKRDKRSFKVSRKLRLFSLYTRREALAYGLADSHTSLSKGHRNFMNI